MSGRGNPGEEESGSNAGSSVGAGRFTPAAEGRLGWALILLGEESIMADIYQKVVAADEDFSNLMSDRAWTRLTPRLILEELCAVDGIMKNENHVEVWA